MNIKYIYKDGSDNNYIDKIQIQMYITPLY